MALKLSLDPVPVGVPVTATFTPDKVLAARDRTAELKIDKQQAGDDSARNVWQETFPVMRLSERLLRVQLVMPASAPTTSETNRQETVSCTHTRRQ